MKKLMYFLVGFALVVFPVRFALADVCYGNSETDMKLYAAKYIAQVRNMDYMDILPCIEYKGSYTTNEEAVDALDDSYSYQSGSVTIDGFQFGIYPHVSGGVCSGTGEYSFAMTFKNFPNNCITTQPDDDNDGLPDSCDFYPEDAIPYSVRLLSYQESSVGIIRSCYETDRKDIFCLGADYDETLSDTITIGSTWQLGSDICSEITTGEKSDVVEGETDIAKSEYTSSTQSGNATDANDPNMDSGEGSDGTETAAEQKIIDNTKITADNVSRLGDYLKEINSSLKNLDYTTSLAKSNETANDEIGSGGTEQDVETGSANAGNVNTEFLEAQTKITTDNSLLTDAPLEYQEKNDIVSKLNGYINNNPISDILDDSGVQITGAVSSVSYLYNGQSIELTVDRFDDEMEAFGAILVGIATLSGIVGLFRG